MSPVNPEVVRDPNDWSPEGASTPHKAGPTANSNMDVKAAASVRRMEHPESAA
jgi:hypothetical protein